MAHDVVGGQLRRRHILYVRQRFLRLREAADRAAGQVDLAEVARHHHLRADAEPRQKHFHLAARGVLRLVEDDERAFQRAPAHIGQRRDLDDALRQQLLVRLHAENILKRVVQRPQIGVHLLLHVAGQEAQPLPRLDGGPRQDDPRHFPRPECPRRHHHGEIRLARSCGTDPQRHRMALNRREVCALSRRSRPHRLPFFRHQNRIVEDRVQLVRPVLPCQPRAVAHLMRRNRHTLPVQAQKLRHQPRRPPHFLFLSGNRKPVAPAHHAAGKRFPDRAQKLILRAQKRKSLLAALKRDRHFVKTQKHPAFLCMALSLL